MLVFVFVFVCVCFACELACCFFAVGVVKIWCSWFVVLVCSKLCVCVGVKTRSCVCVCFEGCAFVSVFKAVRSFLC